MNPWKIGFRRISRSQISTVGFPEADAHALDHFIARDGDLKHHPFDIVLSRGPDPLVREGAPKLRVFPLIALYVFGGGLAGAIVGILQPLARWRAGAAVVGIVAAAPLGVGFLATMAEAGAWSGDHTAFLIIFSVTMGGATGLMYREIFYEDD